MWTMSSFFSENEEDLSEANMKISFEKSVFLKTSVEYLGFIIAQGGITTAPSKSEAIKNYALPITLYNLRSFLGLAAYYRCFKRDCAMVVKSLTDMLKGDLGKISAYKSKKEKIR